MEPYVFNFDSKLVPPKLVLLLDSCFLVVTALWAPLTNCIIDRIRTTSNDNYNHIGQHRDIRSLSPSPLKNG